MTPVKSPHQQEKNSKKVKITEKNEYSPLWTPTEEQKEHSKMMEFMRHLNKQYNLSNTNPFISFFIYIIFLCLFLRLEKLLGPLKMVSRRN